MRTIATISLSAVVLLAATVPAAAQSESNPFLISDRTWDKSSFGVDLGATMDLDDPDFVAVRLDIHLEHMITPQVGVLASLPLAYVAGDGDDISGVADLDVGAFFVTGDPSKRILVRGSLLLPTASDSFEGLFANLFSATARLNDFVGVAPNTFIGRVGGSLVLRQPNMTIRIDGGADIPIASTEDNVDLDRDPIFHVGAGLAFGQPGQNRFVVELANLFNSEASSGEDFVHQASAGMLLDRGNGSIFIGGSTILDAIIEEDDGLPLTFQIAYRSNYGR